MVPLLSRIDKEERVPDFSGICRRCNGRCNRIHDIRCITCDNKFVMFCPQCQVHWDFIDDVPSCRNSISKNLKLELKKLKKLTPTKNELKWLSEQDGYGCLKNLSNDIILTFGEDAVRARNKIEKFGPRLDDSWLGEIMFVRDKKGVIDQLLERRKHKQRRSEGALGSGKWEL